LNGYKNMLIGQTSNGTRSCRVTKLRHNLGDTYGFILLAKLGKKRYIIMIVYNPSTRRRLNGCFGG
jgi:hypothetical protein